MISRLRGTLLTRQSEVIEIATAGGVVYEVEVPLSVFHRLPASGEEVEIRTLHVVREDSATLYGFNDVNERVLFERVRTVKGVGAKLALAMLSTYDAPRLARALVEKDVAALTQISGVGKKIAERLALELSDKVADLAVGAGTAGDGEGHRPAQAAVSALVALGYSFTDADAAVRGALEEGEAEGTDELVRRALARR